MFGVSLSPSLCWLHVSIQTAVELDTMESVWFGEAVWTHRQEWFAESIWHFRHLPRPKKSIPGDFVDKRADHLQYLLAQMLIKYSEPGWGSSCINYLGALRCFFARSFLKSTQISSTPQDISNKFFIGLSKCLSSAFNTSKRLPWSTMKWPHCAGHQGFYGSISGCALNCEFQIQTAQGPRPWAASAAEALCCFTHLKLADMFKFAVPLLDLCAIALWKPCKAKWLKTYMCQGNDVSPFSNFRLHFQNCHVHTFWWDLWYTRKGS